MSLEHAILGFLNSRARSGYDLKTRCFDIEAKAFWTADQAQIYRTLEKLRADRLVAATRRRQTGKPDRKVFEITTAGQQALGEWFQSAPPLPTPRDPFLMQVYFASDASDDVISRIFTERRVAHQSRLDELRAEAVALSRDHSVSARTSALRQAAYDGAIASELAAIDWLDDVLEALAQGMLPASSTTEGSGPQKPLFGLAPA